MKHSDDLLNHLKPPEIPSELRERVLEAAGHAGPKIRATLSDRLWESRSLRLVWAGTVVILLMLNLMPARHMGAPKTSVQLEKTIAVQDPIVRGLMEMLPPQHAPDLDSASAEVLSRIMAELDRPMAGPKPKGNRT